MKRRSFLGYLSAVPAAGVLGGVASSVMAAKTFEVTRTDEEWRAMLTDMEYAVMRKAKTERAGSSPLDKVYDDGVYQCKGCDLDLYSSETKFDSGTGWPSFYTPLENAVETEVDFKMILPRTEVHCRRCGSHMGHVFDDGPAPTGQRYCMNGIAMKFIKA